MKKPNITEGEWVADGFIIHGKDEANHNIISNSFPNKNINFTEAQSNAKAISAVPELIEELIDTYQWMVKLKTTHSHLVSEDELRNIENALKKAGVVL